jgi:hypothetical protein
VIEALLRREPEARLTGEAATALIADVLRREGIQAVSPGGRGESPPPGAFSL